MRKQQNKEQWKRKNKRKKRKENWKKYNRKKGKKFFPDYFGGGWGATFWFFKSLENNMVYSLGMSIYIGKRNRCKTKVLWVLKYGEVGGRTNENQNPPMYDSFWFFVQNFIFCGAGCSFWYIFTHFLNYNDKKKKTKGKK